VREHDDQPEARQGRMMNGIGYVKAGVVEIMQKQQAGWAYLRP
jgi:intracellular sulfur oxidation DsrE/DsrF family protein